MTAYIDKIGFLEIKDRKLLVARNRGKTVWLTPGGKRNEGESDIETLVREVKEELDVDIIPETAQHYGTFEAQAYGKPPGTNVRIACYTASYRGILKPCAEVEEIWWCDYDPANCDKLTATDHLIFQDLQKRGLIDS